MPTYTLRGIEVQFPHEAYECQVTYMEKVITALQEGKNALLESPTGTGKTLCLLCATLAWQESLKAAKAAAAAQAASKTCFEGEVEPGHSNKSWAQMTAEGLASLHSSEPSAIPTIIYASRTHSQLAQVMGELRNCGYRPRAAILGSRQQMCLNPGVKRLPGGAMNQACRTHVTARSCSWYNKVDSWTRMHPDANAEAPDIEELVRLGSAGGPCPFYLSRDMASTADIVFMPYNYLVDAKIRGGLKMVHWPNAVLVFDEAHNVEGVCSDAASFDLTGALLASALQEVQAAVEVALLKRDGEAQGGPAAEGPNYFQMTQDLRMLGALLSKLEGAIASLAASAGNNGYTAKGEFLFDLLAKIGLNADNHFYMERLLDDAADLLGSAAAEQGRKGKGSSERLQELADMLRLAFSTAEPARSGARPSCKGYRVHVHKERSKSGQEVPTLSYWCFEPGVAMAQLCALGVRCILLTSGTLAPLDSFAQELTLDFPVTLENPHVIPNSQVWVGVVPVGPKGVTLNSSYATRTSPAYMDDLGLALANWARIVPDGLLVFFASYTVLEACLHHWKSSAGASAQRGGVLAFQGTLWDRIVKDKQAVIEPRRSDEFQAAAEDYKAKLKDPSSRGAIFFAVCRGKVSEGLDFSDRAGRAVVITGLPFAMVMDPKVRLKKEVLDETRRSMGAAKRGRDGQSAAVRLTGEAWYTQQATRAVNQAMGRVIRHMHDYGAIILADERFKNDSNQRQLSKWLRPLTKVHTNFGEAAASLQRFFADHANFKVPPRAAKPAASQPRDLAFFGSGRAGAAGGGGGGGGLRPGALGCGGPDLLLSSLANVPAAADTSGLPGLPQKNGRLLSALNTRTATVHAAQRAAQPKSSTLMDDLLLSLDSKASVPARAPELGPSSLGLRQTVSRPGFLGSQAGARSAAPRSAQQSSAFGASSNVCGPPDLIRKHQQKLQAAAAAQASKDASRGASQKLASSSQQAVATGPAANSSAPVKNAVNTMPWQPTMPQQSAAVQQDQENSKAAQNTTRTEAVSAKEKATPLEYLSQLQAGLPREAYESVVALLKAYRSRKDSHALIDGIVAILRPTDRRHLLPRFEMFIDKPDRPWFTRCISQLVGESSGSGSQGSDAGGGTAGRPATGAAALRQAGRPAAPAGPPSGQPSCAVCGKTSMQAPWAARCGHVACYGCWGQALAKAHLCPTCGAQAQQHQLVPKFFM
ncbi:Regulator of telomere elongation helicase 1 [Coccomyxa sp. Obi]|nr:Regulator of telomere elongation helicase 1 [Coccomyxa sp. Obi]